MNKEPECYGCTHMQDAFGNYVECTLYAKNNTFNHLFVDYWYWNDGAPDKCPLKKHKEFEPQN